MSDAAGRIGAGLAPARAARPIPSGERIHVVGAAGAGASAAALLAAAAGASVSGCDRGGGSPYTRPFAAHGISLAIDHDGTHVLTGDERHVDRLAVTKALTAIEPHHPELEAARAAGIAVEPWQQVVADAAASHGGRLVAIAGTHGKSTSAGWLVHLLRRAGADPAAFVGASLPGEDGAPASTARWGRGDVFVVEADEYAGNFDPYRPSIAVVLDVEWDHPDVFEDRASVIAAFERWVRAEGEGERRVVVNVSDPGGAELAGRLRDLGEAIVPVVDAERDAALLDALYRPVAFGFDGGRLTIEGLPAPGGEPGDDRLEAPIRLAGRHNAANAACVAAAAGLLGIGPDAVADGLASFAGVGRRLEPKGDVGGVLVFDDYAHHPTAIRATIAALRESHPGRRLWVAHEPLTFHRTAAMRTELAAALAEADRVVVADIWAGRDPDTTIASAAGLAAAVSERLTEPATAPGSVEATADELARRVEPGDVVVAMGGGRSYVIAERLVSLLGSGHAE